MRPLPSSSSVSGWTSGIHGSCWAALVAHAEKLAAQQLPWIPDVQPDTVLLLGKGLTGAISSSAYLYSPWANSLGGAG